MSYQQLIDVLTISQVDSTNTSWMPSLCQAQYDNHSRKLARGVCEGLQGPSSGPKALLAKLRGDTEQGTSAGARFSAVSCFHECFSLQGGRTTAEASPPTVMIEARSAEQKKKM